MAQRIKVQSVPPKSPRMEHLTILTWSAMIPDLNPVDHLWKQLKLAVWRMQFSVQTTLLLCCFELYSSCPAPDHTLGWMCILYNIFVLFRELTLQLDRTGPGPCHKWRNVTIACRATELGCGHFVICWTPIFLSMPF